LSVLWLDIVTCEACVRSTISSHNTDNVLYELHVSTFNQVCNFS